MDNEDIDRVKTPIAMEAHCLRTIRKVMRRLYSEKYMNADEMRDNAQLLQSVLDSAWEE